jgi:single-stranded-DNA-specific exonuclease
MTTSTWTAAPTPPEAESLARPEWPAWLAPVLARRGLTTAAEAEAFLSPSLEHLHDPLLLPDMGAALDRLAEGAVHGERAAIVGDYDVDGVSASAMLSAVFDYVGLEPETILPHRLAEGYGFQLAHVERAREAGCSIVVTADCGSTSYEAVGAALEAGLAVIVTDHHVPGRDLPEGALHVNPKLEHSSYPFDELCGAGIAFKLALALAERRGKPLDPERLLLIACLGTIADVVPLLGENRVIASLGLAGLGRTRSPGLRALASVSRTKPPFTATDVGFRLGPRINAAGRMSTPDDALELLLTRDAARGEELALALDSLNQERRRAESLAVEQARETFAERDELPPILVAWSPEWHKGVVGIAAGRLAREFHRPTVLLSVDGDTATGSGRSVRGIELHSFLNDWAEDLERFGGHSQAIGMTVLTERLPVLRSRWEAAGAERWDPQLLKPRYEYDAHLSAAEVGHELLQTLARLEPCGAGNRTPLFRLGPLTLQRPPRYFGENHVSLRCADQSGAAFDVVGWRWADAAKGLPAEFEVLGRFELDSYTGQPVLHLVDARGAGGYS